MEIKIALCDDNKEDLKHIQHEIQETIGEVFPVNWKYGIDTYENGNMLMRKLKQVAGMHILFLDIDMPGANGMEIAQKLEHMKHTVHVIFITNRADLVFEAIHYRPFRFIRKEYLHKELGEAMEAIVKTIQDEMLFFEVEVQDDKVQIRVEDVVYLESRGHYVAVHRRKQDTEVVRARISDFTERLEKNGFVRTHIGYIVNIRDIYCITSKEIRLDNKEIIPISRKYAEHVKEAYARYARRFLRGIP